MNWPRLVSIFLGQWHEKITGIYSGGDPLICFYIQDKDLVFQRRHNCGSPLNLPLKMVEDMADKWTRIKVMVDWTDEPSGYFDVYVDDSLAISYDGPTLRKKHPVVPISNSVFIEPKLAERRSFLVIPWCTTTTFIAVNKNEPHLIS